MKRIVEEITVTHEDGPMEGDNFTHPAFAQIRASRVTGHASLYGSDFLHQHYVIVQIAPSQLKRGLSNDWMHSSIDPYIEVALSEAQWATFVSSMNVGCGPGCTLTYRNGKQIPMLPDPKSKHDQFKSEAKETCAEALSRIDELKSMIEELKVSEKQKDILRKKADSAKQSMTSSLPFVEKQFGKHMEATVEKAKIEINAYAVNAVIRAEIKSLGGDESLPLLQLGQSE